MKNQKNSSCYRPQRGVVGIVMLTTTLLLLIAIAALSIDVSRVAAVRCQLQNAADAAALAGARKIDIDDGQALHDAVAVASRNFADGRAICNRSVGTQLSVRVIPSEQKTPGRVSVEVTMSVRHMLAPIAGRDSDEIRVRADAGPVGTISRAEKGKVFPLAISIDTLPSDEGRRQNALNQLSLTDTVCLHFDAQESVNAAFTTFGEDAASYNFLREVIKQATNDELSQRSSIPSVEVGDKINLCDGLAGPVALSDPLTTQALVGRLVLLPVFSGSPQQCGQVVVIGFVSGRIEGIEMNPERRLISTLSVRLLKNARGVQSGPLKLSEEDCNCEALKLLSAGAVKLLPTLVNVRAISCAKSDSCFQMPAQDKAIMEGK